MDVSAKLTELFQDEQFKKDAKTLTTVEDLQALFAKYNLEMTTDEVAELCGKIARQMAGDELSEDELEDVAGGVIFITVGAIALGAACIGSFAMGAYNAYKKNY